MILINLSREEEDFIHSLYNRSKACLFFLLMQKYTKMITNDVFEVIFPETAQSFIGN